MCHAKDKAVRFRACQAVSKLLNALDEEAEVDDDMWDLLQDTMLCRMTDKIPVVRVQAINALGRLQDATDVECPIIQGYLQRMECDSSPGGPGRGGLIPLGRKERRRARAKRHRGDGKVQSQPSPLPSASSLASVCSH